MTLRLRLFLAFLTTLLIGMGAAAALAWAAAEALYLQTQRENLLAQAEAAALSAVTISAPLEPITYNQSVNFSPGVRTRVLDLEGVILMEFPSATNAVAADWPVSAAEVASREEVTRAHAGEPAAAVRTLSDGNRVLYAAAPVFDTEGEVTAVSYLAEPLPRSFWQALTAETRGEIILLFLAAILLALLAGWMQARSISRPIETLTRAADRASRGEAFPPVPEDSSIRNLREMSAAVNRMAAAVAKADRAKSAFVADVSHELRTPLTILKGTIETLRGGAARDPKARGRFLASMDRETDRLIRMVNDLLILARAESGVLNLRCAPVDLAALARDRAERFAKLAADAGVRITIGSERGTPRRLPAIPADAERLVQVFDNLIDNALRFAPRGSAVRVRFRLESEYLECSVADSGSGIDPEHLPMLFERFYRTDPSRTRTSGGTGLGLAICKVLIEAHGGEIRAESALGRGARFIFRLPRRPPDPKT
jgi:signal transduction histidine kinase